MSVSRADLEANRVRERLAQSEIAPQLLSEAQMEASLRATLGRRPGGALWLFAYGSLLWNPTVRHVETRLATAYGYHRRFCLWSRINRGTPREPGLVLGLDAGGSCAGLLMRLADAEAEGELRLLWRREMMTGAYRPCWVRTRAADGPVAALGFVIRRDGPAYAGRLSDAAIVERLLGGARGLYGDSREYLERTAAALAGLGIHDRHVARLAALVSARRPAAG